MSLTIAIPAPHILLVFVRLLRCIGRVLSLPSVALGLVRFLPTTGDIVPAVFLQTTSLAADWAWRRRNIVLGFAFVLPLACAARFALLKGIQILRAVRCQIHRLRCRAGSSLCASDVVDLGLQCFPRRQPSTVEVLFSMVHPATCVE